MKIRPVGAELVHADGQTDRQRDMTKLIVSFSNFANAPKIQSVMYKEIIAVCSQIHTKHINTLIS